MRRAYAACRVCRGPWSRPHPDRLIAVLERLDEAERTGQPWGALGRAGFVLECMLEPLLGVHVECLVGAIAGAELLRRSAVRAIDAFRDQFARMGALERMVFLRSSSCSRACSCAFCRQTAEVALG